MVTAQNWYNLNASRQYPLDTAATGESDAGENIPDDVLLDAHLRFPSTVGRYAYVSAMHVSDSLISLTFLATTHSAATLLASSSAAISDPFTPLAVVSVPRSELVPYRQVAVEPLYPGVGGWVVLGPATQQPTFHGVFASPAQSALLPRVARSYEPLPVTDTAKIHQATELTGLVLLRAGTDIEIVKAEREIDGQSREAIVVRLRNATGRNVLEDYIGPCGGRPESRTCAKPAIEAINSVRPDCNGNINIRFTTTSCPSVGQQVGCSEGLVVDYCLGLEDACTRDRRLPKDGDLPNDYTDLCLVSSESASSISLEPESSESTSASSSSSAGPVTPASSESCAPLPRTEDLTDGAADDYVVKNGAFTAVNGVAYRADSLITRNVSVYDYCAYTHVRDRTFAVDMQLRDTGSEPNAGVVVGYRDFQAPIPNQAVTNEYFVAELYKPGDAFRVRFWSGSHFIVLAKATPLGLLFNRTYTIEITTVDIGGDNTTATCKLKDGVTTLATIEFTTTRFHQSEPSYFGVHAEQSQPHFLESRLS